MPSPILKIIFGSLYTKGVFLIFLDWLLLELIIKLKKELKRELQKARKELPGEIKKAMKSLKESEPFLQENSFRGRGV